MTYEFEPDKLYRMPTHFGPRTGPRQGPDGRKFLCHDNPKATSISVSFVTRAELLSRMLPAGFVLAGEPVVTVTATYETEIEWLAGRGYNKLGVRFPATYAGDRDEVTGMFLCVLWENMADPIITGRDELGVPKIYCELPEPDYSDTKISLSANWCGFRFLDLEVQNLKRMTDGEILTAAAGSRNAGDLHLKYVPKCGEPGTADVSYVTHIPAATPNRKVLEQMSGDGTVEFHAARWEDMPTQYNIVNALQALVVIEYRGATVSKSVGSKDLSDVRILR